MTDEPRWLDEDERRAWLALTMVSMRLPAVMDARMQHDSAMTLFEYLVMAMLSEQEGRTLPMSSVAQMTSSTLPRMSHVVKRLESRGWIRRAAAPDDGRTTLATLTDAGLAAVVAAAPDHVGFVRETVFDRLTRAQVRQLDAIAQRLLPALWPGGVPLPDPVATRRAGAPRGGD